MSRDWHGVVHWAATRWEFRQPPFTYTDQLRYTRTVPRDAAGRPGYTLLSTAERSPVRTDMGRGARSDISVPTARRSGVIVSCTGRIAKLGAARERVHLGLAEAGTHHALEMVVPFHEGSVAGEVAYGFTARLRGLDGAELEYTDWFFDHEGWGFILGVLGLVSELDSAIPLAEGVIASWRWLPPEVR